MKDKRVVIRFKDRWGNIEVMKIYFFQGYYNLVFPNYLVGLCRDLEECYYSIEELLQKESWRKLEFYRTSVYPKFDKSSV